MRSDPIRSDPIGSDLRGSDPMGSDPMGSDPMSDPGEESGNKKLSPGSDACQTFLILVSQNKKC